MINLDGLRKDRINLCPNLKSFRDKSNYFSKMITVSPYTLAALHAMMSGTYPSKNGVDAYYHMFRFKKDTIITIAELLKERGYYTKCDVISENILPTKGFDEITTFDEKTVNFEKRHSEIIRNISTREKFFLFLHYEGVHSHVISDVLKKYDPKDNNDEFFTRRFENEQIYDSYMPECDSYVTSILQTIDSLTIADKTIVILFSDHGTSLGEKRGEKFYGVYVYDYTINTFCMIRIPSFVPQIINTQCSILDIFPTIMEIACNSGRIDQIVGTSLFRLIEKPESGDREVFVETGGLYGFWPSPKKHNVFCIRINDKKLIYNAVPQSWEFYDIKNDPEELNNLYDKKLNEVSELKSKILCFFKENNIHINGNK